jgi:predicted O-methyltransferase YrrM
VIPPLVVRARRLAGPCDCPTPCRDEDGLLLHVLAGRRGVARAGEIGTGCGVSAAWIVSALVPGTPFVTVGIDTARSVAARELFAADDSVSVLAGDWRRPLLAEAPFDLLVLRDGDAADDPTAAAELLAPGGTVVVAGTAPSERRRWLDHPVLQATAVETGGPAPVVLGIRIR